MDIRRGSRRPEPAQDEEQELIRFGVARSDEEWDALLEKQPYASVYHTMAWLRVQERHCGAVLHPLTIERDGEAIGLFPVFLARRGIFRVSSSPRGVDTLFLGPLVEPGLLGEVLDGYEGWARAHRVDFTAIAFTREIDAVVATERGYKCQQLQTCLLDLRPGEDALFKRSRKDCRTKIRKARRLGVAVIEGDITPWVDRYVELSSGIYAQSNQKTPLTREFLMDFLTTLSASGNLLTSRAEVDGRLLGINIAAHYGKTLYAIDIVSTEEARKYDSNRLMTWEAITWGCRHGMEVFDLVGANMPSYRDYKLSFGGALSRYSNITKSHTAIARAAVWLRTRTVWRLRIMRFRRSAKGRIQGKVHEQEGAPGVRSGDPEQA